MDIIQVRANPDAPWTAVPALVGPRGEKGNTGEQGPKGDTPVKGVDYFTEEDLLNIPYSNLHSGLNAATMQAAVDEMASTRIPDNLVTETTMPSIPRTINWVYG